jgi:glycerol-3-phosphate dehydrogenase subunit B
LANSLKNSASTHFDLIVAGGGIAGLTAAATAVTRGLRVALVNTGPGSFVMGAGSVAAQNVAQNLAQNAAQNVAQNLESRASLEEALGFFCDFTALAGCPFRGGLGETRYLPTILGSFQSVSMAPFYLWNGDPSASSQVAVVGIRGLATFDSNFVAERLAYHASKLERGAKYVACEIALPLEKDTLPGTLQFANRYDREYGFRMAVRNALRPIAAKANVIILPGMLGLKSGPEEIGYLETELDCLICELPTLPPSIPGMRLFNRLEARLRKAGVEFFSGFPIQELQIEGGHCDALLIEAPARPLRLSAGNVILATGPFSGKLLGSGFAGFNRDLRPIDAKGAVIVGNLFGAGAILHRNNAHVGNAMAILTGYSGGMLAAGVGAKYAQG